MSAVVNPGKSSRLPSFLRRGNVGAFLTIVMAGQLTYSAFEAFKGSLLIPLTEVLGIGIDDFGKLMSILGLAMFMYVPAGWVNNRFTVRSILLAWSAWRLVTFLILYLIPGLSFTAMMVIAFTWAVWDAIGWPAVVNGVSFVAQDSDSKGRGLAMGLLETIRRAAEFLMNIIIVGLIWIYPAQTKPIMLGFAIGYSLLLIPLILALLKYVPKNAIAKEEGKSDNLAALIGLGKVLARPRVWLAGIAAMCVYWTYVNLIYSSAPYIKMVFNASDGAAAAFGIFNTGFIGIIAGLVSGLVADYVFKSSTMMMAVSLGVTAVGVGLVYLLPHNESMLWPAMILLMVMAIGIFMGKAVILAPIAELHLPEEINGSAMAVGSFLAYASILWGNYTTSDIVERYKADAYVGYSYVFLITLIVAAVGTVCAVALVVINRRAEAAEAAAQPVV
ncbi:MAG: MFS transporter [Actinomycetaceae bacterium]|nr:MFS transporter [Actinomycetaceae bacterium]